MSFSYSLAIKLKLSDHRTVTPIFKEVPDRTNERHIGVYINIDGDKGINFAGRDSKYKKSWHIFLATPARRIDDKIVTMHLKVLNQVTIGHKY